MILSPLKKSRRDVYPGDVFVFQPEGLAYYFGRVVDVEANLGGLVHGILLFFYNVGSDEPEKIPELSNDSFLIPPVVTNKKGWTLGYFQTVGNIPLRSEELSGFSFYSKARGQYFDHRGNTLPGPRGITATFGLSGIQGIDLEIANRLKPA